jgi:Cdc6-like AAA superfamily ATPase
MTDEEKIQLKYQASQVFTPGLPIDEKDLFAGRIPLIGKVITILGQRGQHAIIFGERGVGKTSFANVLKSYLSTPTMILAPRVECITTDTFSSIWKKVFSQIEVIREKQTAGYHPKDASEKFTLADTFKGAITPDQIQDALERLIDAGNIVVVIIDEFDRIADRTVRRLMADTVKSMSDRGDRATLLIVGVADTVVDLIAEHESVDRNLVQIPMPRMSTTELEMIITKALPRLGMEIDPHALARISFFSRGFPFYTHKLGSYAAIAALDDDKLKIETDHVDTGIRQTVDDGQYTHLRTYVTATYSARKIHLFRQVLLACALARTDELGFFSASDVREPMTGIMHRDYDVPSFARHLKEFCELKRGQILERTGDKYSVRFRFANPMMQPFVTMKGFADKMWNPHPDNEGNDQS